MSRVAMLADTHVPSRAAALPGWVREELAAADHVIHAGDVDSRAALEAIEALSADLTVVAGNVDPPIDLPRVATATIGGVTFVVTHGTGPAESYRDRVAGIVREHDPGAATDDDSTGPVGVSGHSHEVLDTVHDGIRLLNPGSATGAFPAERTTMVRAAAENGDLDVELLEG